MELNECFEKYRNVILESFTKKTSKKTHSDIYTQSDEIFLIKDFKDIRERFMDNLKRYSYIETDREKVFNLLYRNIKKDFSKVYFCEKNKDFIELYKFFVCEDETFLCRFMIQNPLESSDDNETHMYCSFDILSYDEFYKDMPCVLEGLELTSLNGSSFFDWDKNTEVDWQTTENMWCPINNHTMNKIIEGVDFLFEHFVVFLENLPLNMHKLYWDKKFSPNVDKISEQHPFTRRLMKSIKKLR